MARVFWLILGAASLALGIIGAVLPLLPTTPFLLASAYAFARSSPRLHDWLIEHPRFGPPIRDWREERAISRPAKTLAVIAMLAALALSVIVGVREEILIVQAVALLAVAAFILSRPSPASED